MQDYPTWLASTLASDATNGQGVLPAWIRSLRPDSRVIGPAFVALMSLDDNLVIREVLASPPVPGSVLIVGGGSESRTATIGGLMALEMQNAGITALITDGLVRDAGEIRELRFDVWCRGLTPIAPSKNGPARVGGSVSLGGIHIHDGDLIIGDEDGVVVWPREQIDELLARAEAKYQQDNERLVRLRVHRDPGI
ncbi:MAG: RraA family protein [Ktedonobacteraceae bacterium]